MNKFRDFLYNKSDMVVVLVIIVVAAGLIFNRSSALLNSSQIEKPQIENKGILELKEDVKEGQIVGDLTKPAVTSETPTPVAVTPPATTNPAMGEESVPKKVKTFRVKSGQSSQVIARNLEKKGLIKSASSFMKYTQSKGLDVKLRQGKFKIKEGSSNEEVAKILIGT